MRRKRPYFARIRTSKLAELMVRFEWASRVKSDSYAGETYRIPPLRHILDLFPLINPVN